MKNLGLLTLLLLCLACGHGKRSSPKVQLPYSPELVSRLQGQTLRAPASVELASEEPKSLRRVYFGALYYQYLTLGHYLGQASQIAFCPQFHHDKLETEVMHVPTGVIYRSAQVEQEGREFFPELAFTDKFSLQDHHGVIREELNVLCEEGRSDNFYKFDNLVNHHAQNRSFHQQPNAMAAILKIPIFANYYLLKMLQGHESPVHFTHPEEKHMITLSRVLWFEDYIKHASGARQGFIRNKMVRR